MKLFHLGTFDVANFGDLLFPLVLERRLEHLVDELVVVSPVGGVGVWEDAKQAVPVSTAVEQIEGAAGVVLGGGHLLHAGPPGVAKYRTDELEYLATYPRLCAAAAELARASGAPLALNAPGVVGEASPGWSQLTRWISSSAEYMSVRDAASARLLRRAGVVGQLDVVPDTALDVHRLWSAEELADTLENAFAARGRSKPSGGILAVHLNPRFAPEPADVLAETIERIASQTDLFPVLLAIGPCHGDSERQREVGELLGESCLTLDEPRSLREITSVLSTAEMYLGSSLHGLVTSCAFGRKAALVSSPLHKFTGFLEHFGLERWIARDWEQMETLATELAEAPPEPWQRVPHAAAPLLDAHWQRIASALEAPRRDPKELHELRLESDEIFGTLLPEMVQAALSRASNARAAAEERLREGEDRQAALEKRSAELEAALAAADTARASADRKLFTELRDEVASVRAKLEAAQARAGEAARLADARSSAAEEARGRAEVLEREHARATSDLERERAELTRLHSEMTVAQSALIAEESATAKLRERLDSMSSELQAALAEIETRSQRMDDMTSSYAALEQELAETHHLAETTSAENAEVRIALQETNKRARATRADLAASERRLAEARELLASAHARTAERDREVEAARRDAADLEARLADSRKLAAGQLRERDQALVSVMLALERVDDRMNRVAESRSWRHGHRFFSMLNRLTFRKPVGPGAVREAQAEVAEVRDFLRRWSEWPETALEPSSSVRTAAASSSPPPPPAPPTATEEERAALARALRERLGPPPALEDGPFVSILVLTRDGRAHLEQLLPALATSTEYPSFEVIVVDNGSSDGSTEYLAGLDLPFPLRVIRNEENRSFAAANNQAAAEANGQLVLLLNNDVEPVEPGWLAELVDCRERSGARVVGGTLLDPAAGRATPSGWEVQHRGIRFDIESGVLKGINQGNGVDPLGDTLGEHLECPAVTAACLLVDADLYARLGGLHPGYSYGTEDVDFCLGALEHGESVVCSGRSFLFHNESSTQQREGREFMRLNRIGNRQLFAERWGPRVWHEVELDRLAGTGYWSVSPAPRVAITRTSHRQEDGFGDWYTAVELGEALEREGFEVSYVQARQDEWHKSTRDVDYVVGLLDRFDPSQAFTQARKIAWIRNWTDRWIERGHLEEFDVLLASSDSSCRLVAERVGRHADVAPLATNPARFAPADPTAGYEADYVFTGNRWNVERPIENRVEPRAGERFRVFGRGWESTPLAPYTDGEVPYDALPAIYSSARVVIDDSANHALPFDSVNSRVFDALACGAVVVTNCKRGALELFDDDFPAYESARELRVLLDRLLAEPGTRQRLADRYRQIVLDGHTYSHRASQIKSTLLTRAESLRFCIKIGAPNWEVAHRWGDLYFARALRRELEGRGHDCLIQVLDEWNELEGLQYDVVLHLKGLSRYTPRSGQLNVLWTISHPALVTGLECDLYDLVCVASERFAATLATQTSTPVQVLQQATDPAVFFPDPDERYARELTFVGNSRKVKRRILEDLLPIDRDLAIWGGDWDGIVPSKHVVGDFLSQSEVRKVYSSAGIVLNDHWDDMREHGFVSNRIYDALACGGVVLSDRLPELDLFEGAVVSYETTDELRGLVTTLLADPDEARHRAERGRELVLAKHTFRHRVDELLSLVDQRRAELGMQAQIRPAPIRAPCPHPPLSPQPYSHAAERPEVSD